MSVFRSRPTMRWLVPSAAAVLVVGGGAAVGAIVANAEPSLPERSAAQLLVDVQTAQVDGLSGTVVQRADLGLPAITGGTSGGGADLMKLITGNNTVRVWYAGPDKARVAVLSTLGETDVIRNGADVWLWNSRDNTATNYRIPAESDRPATPTAVPTGLPSTPADAAAMALAAIDPSTSVSTTGTAKVAGRDAYELVLVPRDTASLVGQVRLAIDAEHRIPLRVDVYAKDATAAALRIGFEQISFAVPDAEQFTFNPPPGAKISKATAADAKKALRERAEGAESGKRLAKHAPAGKDGDPAPKIVGTGWTSIVVATMPTGADGADAEKAAAAAGLPIDAILGQLPKVSGSWGSGRLLSSALFNALVTDDGRVLVGAVTPEKLYEAAAG
ncbi:MAG TPA: sigma-E factor regulatory protein RseB domain-containing protein [Actinoplanes sp.]|nr:sigma-E factor regulatory protein RseB domain-containing protein [Actinoplanes sp.]